MENNGGEDDAMISQGSLIAATAVVVYSLQITTYRGGDTSGEITAAFRLCRVLVQAGEAAVVLETHGMRRNNANEHDD